MTETEEVLRRAMALAETKPRAALPILAAGLEAARVAGDRDAIDRLLRHAAVVAAGSNSWSTAARYIDEMLQMDASDPVMHLSSGEAHTNAGERDLARAAFVRAHELAQRAGDQEVAEEAAKTLVALK